MLRELLISQWLVIKREVTLAAKFILYLEQVKIDRKSKVRPIAEYLQRIDLASKKNEKIKLSSSGLTKRTPFQ